MCHGSLLPRSGIVAYLLSRHRAQAFGASSPSARRGLVQSAGPQANSPAAPGRPAIAVRSGFQVVHVATPAALSALPLTHLAVPRDPTNQQALLVLLNQDDSLTAFRTAPLVLHR